MSEKIEVKGLSQFFFAAIPYVLGLAAIVWLTFGQGYHDFRRMISQEKRHAEVVGASPSPLAPIRIAIKNKRGECRVIDRAEIDGNDLWVYWHKVCDDHYEINASTIHWDENAPDGTLLSSGYEFAGEPNIGQRSEFHTNRIKDDARVASIELRASWNNE